jgi:hypothetical protein
VAENVNTIDFSAGVYDSELAFGQADSGAQWEAGTDEDIAGPSRGAKNPLVEDTTSTPTSGLNTFPQQQQLETDNTTRAYDVPSMAVAYWLVSHYMRTVQDWIPVIPTAFLDEEVNRYYTEPLQVTNVWLATFHVVLAIGARHAHITERNGAAQCYGTRYYTRAAQLLGLIDLAAVTATPDVALVQVS